MEYLVHRSEEPNLAQIHQPAPTPVPFNPYQHFQLARQSTGETSNTKDKPNTENQVEIIKESEANPKIKADSLVTVPITGAQSNLRKSLSEFKSQISVLEEQSIPTTAKELAPTD